MKKDIKKVIVASIITVLSFGGLVGTFAYLSIGGKQSLANSFTSGCLNITLENESNAISLTNAYPVSDVEGLGGGYTL